MLLWPHLSRAQPERSWWDILHYDISIRPDYTKKWLSGSNSIRFRVTKPGQEMQIDLQPPMLIKKISWHGTTLPVQHDADTWLVHFPKTLPTGAIETIDIDFEGHPKESTHPPFDNGWIWTTDAANRPWMTVACEGSGASIWLPCKNLLNDEPDSGMSMSITAPDSLTAIANGRQKNKTINKDGTTTWTWAVVNPINNYDMIPYIGKYTTWHTTFKGEKGPLDCDFWVLDQDLQKAKRQFAQVDSILHCFEHWMGPYPFYEDSYKVVEAPYWGMEHQSAIAYGNGFANGFHGIDLSHTGWGMKWDFILVHETAHEWFGNNITAQGDGDSWIHEGFAKYIETIYTGYTSGPKAGDEYAAGINKRIRNDQPIVTGNTQDKYDKGSAMLHMIRQIIGDDTFRIMLRALNKKFYHQTVTTAGLTRYCSKITGHDLSKIFQQYLYTTNIPTLEYTIRGGDLKYRWSNCVPGFDMPMVVTDQTHHRILLHPTDRWQHYPTKLPGDSLTIDPNYYVKASR